VINQQRGLQIILQVCPLNNQQGHPQTNLPHFPLINLHYYRAINLLFGQVNNHQIIPLPNLRVGLPDSLLNSLLVFQAIFLRQIQVINQHSNLLCRQVLDHQSNQRNKLASLFCL